MDRIALWFRAFRPFAYPASVMPLAIGTAAAAIEGFHINLMFTFIALVGVLFAHTGANLLSDYFDFLRGIDRKGIIGGSGVLVDGTLKPASFLAASIVFFFLALLAAVFFCVEFGFGALFPVAIGAVCAVMYSMPRIGIKDFGLGEPAVFFTFGICISMGAYYIQTGHYAMSSAYLSIPFSSFITAILFANNMRDVDSDAAVGIRTIAYRLGRKASILVYALMITLPYVLVAVFVMARILPIASFLCFITVPITIKLISDISGDNKKYAECIFRTDVRTARLSLIFGIAYLIGMFF